MKIKKRIFTIAGLLLIVVIGATFAYYTSNTTFENVFNAGKYKITLTEEFVSPDNWLPGETIPKTVKAKNDGTVPAAVRISYTEQWLKEIDGVETDITSQVSPNPAIINFANQGDWTLSNGYYYYKYILEPTNETSSFISGVTLDSNLDSVTCTGEGNTKTCEAQNKASGAKYKLTFTIQTIQYDVYKSEWNTDVEITEKPNAITYLTRQVEGQITPGDVIGIGETEDFYVMSTNAEKTTLISKYNLLVGRYVDENDEWHDYSPNDSGYGLQSVNAVGGYYQDTVAGIVDFSNTAYWDNGEGTLLSPYNQNNASYDGNPFPYVYNENSSISYYINEYVNNLKVMGAPSTITGRLLSYEEAEEAMHINEVVINEWSWTSIILNEQDFWTGSTNNDTPIGITRSDNGFNSDVCDCNVCGVRPVIEIPTSELQ